MDYDIPWVRRPSVGMPVTPWAEACTSQGQSSNDTNLAMHTPIFLPNESDCLPGGNGSMGGVPVWRGFPLQPKELLFHAANIEAGYSKLLRFISPEEAMYDV